MADVTLNFFEDKRRGWGLEGFWGEWLWGVYDVLGETLWKKHKSLLMTFTSTRKHCTQMLHVHFAQMKGREREKTKTQSCFNGVLHHFLVE